MQLYLKMFLLGLISIAALVIVTTLLINIGRYILNDHFSSGYGYLDPNSLDNSLIWDIKKITILFSDNVSGAIMQQHHQIYIKTAKPFYIETINQNRVARYYYATVRSGKVIILGEVNNNIYCDSSHEGGNEFVISF